MSTSGADDARLARCIETISIPQRPAYACAFRRRTTSYTRAVSSDRATRPSLAIVHDAGWACRDGGLKDRGSARAMHRPRFTDSLSQSWQIHPLARGSPSSNVEQNPQCAGWASLGQALLFENARRADNSGSSGFQHHGELGRIKTTDKTSVPAPSSAAWARAWTIASPISHSLARLKGGGMSGTGIIDAMQAVTRFVLRPDT